MSEPVADGRPAEAESPVLTEVLKPGILLIRLNRAASLNALNVELIVRLREILTEVREDETVRAIILTGSGRAFCAGLDLRGYGEPPGARGPEGRPQAHMRIQQHIADLHELFRGTRAPIIAAINGAAAGAGMSLSLFCDIRLMASDATLHAAFIHRGLSAGDLGASWLLPRMIGYGPAAELLLTGRTVTAQEAVGLGLIAAFHEPEELMVAATATADQIASHSPMGVWMTKEVLWSNLEIPSFRAGIELENRTQVLCALTDDHREAVESFLQKRPARYTNH